MQRYVVETIEEIVVAQCDRGAKLFRVGGVTIVHLDRAVQRQLVMHFQAEIDSAGSRAGTQHGRHLPVRGLHVEGSDLGLNRLEIWRRASRRRRDCGANLLCREEPRALDGDPAQLSLGDVKANHTPVDVLLRNIDKHRTETSVVIRLLEIRPGVLDDVDRLRRSEIRIHRALDDGGRQHGVAEHAVFEHVERFLVFLLRARDRRQRAHEQHEKSKHLSRPHSTLGAGLAADPQPFLVTARP